MSSYLDNGRAVSKDPLSDHKIPANSNFLPGDEPTPLLRKRPKAADIPYDALGPLRPVVEAIELKTQAPAALAMQSVLAAASLATQAHADVETLAGSSPLSLFFLSVAASGERKSSCDGLAIGAIRDWENAQLKQYARDKTSFDILQEKYEHARRVAIKSGTTEGSVVEIDEVALLSPPIPPAIPRRILSDVTYEGVLCHFEMGDPSVGIFSDEGGQFFGGHGMSADNRLKTATGLSKLWDAAPLNRTRAGTSHVTLSGRRCSLHMMIQPTIAEDVLSDRMFRDQGLLSRFLSVWPESNIGKRLILRDVQYSQGMELASNVLEEYYGRIIALLNIDPVTSEDDPLELIPPILELDKSTRQLLVGFFNAVEEAQRKNAPLSNITGFASKAAEQAARIAGVMTLYQSVQARAIDTDTIKNAITLMNWYLNETRRLLDTGQVGPEIYQAQLLLEWLQGQPEITVINVRSVVRRGPGSIRDTKTVRALFAILENNGWLHRCSGGAVIDGKKVTQAWRINHT